MKILLEPAEAEEYFFNALCNGSQELAHNGIRLDYTEEDVAKARAAWKEAKPDQTMCREDVWMGILKEGGKLTFTDEENDEHIVILKDVHEKVQLTPLKHLQDMISENDDAITADCILQTVILGEVIYG